MKKYSKPEIEVTEFDLEDIITTSEGIIEEAAPKSIVGGANAANYGAKDFSIFNYND